MSEKRCTKCGELKPLTAFGLGKRRTGDSRPLPRCKACVTAHARDWQTRNAERARETRSRWRQTDKGKASNRAGNKRYRESNRDKVQAYRSHWAQTEQGRACLDRARKKWADAHPLARQWQPRPNGQPYLVSLDATSGFRTYHECIADRNAADPLEVLIQSEAVAGIVERLVSEKGVSREAALAMVEAHF